MLLTDTVSSMPTLESHNADTDNVSSRLGRCHYRTEYICPDLVHTTVQYSTTTIQYFIILELYKRS